MKPWQLGNTSVRSATRLRDGLIALADSGLEGSLRGSDAEDKWRQVLGEYGVVSLGHDATNSVGRKWRAALCRLGFLYDKVGKGLQGQVGLLDHITPSGHRLIESSSVLAQQDCYLRALSGMWLDVASSRHKVPGNFSPLRHVLRVMRELENETGGSEISAVEFALFVQTTTDADTAKSIASEVIRFREKRAEASNKQGFDASAIEALASGNGAVQASTFRDYMDMNLRYLKATGLFHGHGRGISLVPRKSVVVEGLIAEGSPPPNKLAYWVSLTQGSPLPTDELEQATKALAKVRLDAERRGITVSSASTTDAVTAADLGRERMDLEGEIALDEETRYYRRQRGEWREILEFLRLMDGKPPNRDGDVVVPSGERPAYLEWAVWRAFLAINSLTNAPFEARRFPVDQDMRPTSHAPGGGPDLVFVFGDSVLVVEVTLSESVRQSATEMAPVQHHVYQVQKDNPDKRVVCLFVAPTLTTSTVNAFQRQEWYPDGAEEAVDVFVVPATLGQFSGLFEAMFQGEVADPAIMLAVLEESIAAAPMSRTPKAWERKIGKIFERETSRLAS